jgi:transcriptional regulator with XRE-family HTH domain
MSEMNPLKVGSFIRDQRQGAKLSLRKMAGLAGISIPYLSQVERGLRKPSAEILQAIAKGLRISAETLYVQAGILDEHPASDVAAALMGDLTITESQKNALIQIYRAFQDDTGRAAPSSTEGAPPAPGPKRGSKAKAAKRTTTGTKASARGAAASRAGRAKTATSRLAPTRRPTPAARVPSPRSPRDGGGTVSQAGSSPHPAPTRSPATNSLDS